MPRRDATRAPASAARARLAERRSPAAAGRIFAELVPAGERAAIVAALAHSIRCAHRAAPAKWGLRLNPDSIMLKVGFIEVLQLSSAWFHEIVSSAGISLVLRRDKRLAFTPSPYKNAPGCDGCDVDLSHARAAYDLLRDAHEAAIAVAARSPRHTTTVPTHSPGLIVFLAEELGQLLPQPEYLAEAVAALVTMPEELPPDAPIPEGAVSQVLVNRYERDPEARRRCIAHHGTACAACGLEMSARYGPGVEGFIHVHHLTPISELGEETVDPVHDLRPVCPNCHAVIHHGGALRTIGEVRAMLR